MRPARFHVVLAVIWLVVSAAIASGIAAARSESRALERHLGIEQARVREAQAKLERLRGELAYLASPPMLEIAIRRLNLPLTAQEMAWR